MRRLLAQRIVDEVDANWYDRAPPHIRADNMVKPLVTECLANLRVPWEGPNHSVLPHRALGPIYADEAERNWTAIYHFDAHAIQAAKVIGHSRRRRELIFETARAPAPRCFFEWQDAALPELAHGFYVRGDRDSYCFVRWCDHPVSAKPFPIAWGKVSPDDNGRSDLRIGLEETTIPENHWDHLTYESGPLVIFLWALLASTGACTVNRTPTPRGSSKHANCRSPGAAILSFNRVRLTVPKGLIVRDQVVEWERGAGVRRHQVRGHPAWYHVGPRVEGAMLLRWIAAYWRGDARLGLVLKAQDVAFNEGPRA